MMSNSVPESEKEILTGCVSFYTQWFDVCVVSSASATALHCRPPPGSLSVKNEKEKRLHSFFRLEAIATRNKKLLGAPGLTTRSKDATRSKGHR